MFSKVVSQQVMCGCRQVVGNFSVSLKKMRQSILDSVMRSKGAQKWFGLWNAVWDWVTME